MVITRFSSPNHIQTQRIMLAYTSYFSRRYISHFSRSWKVSPYADLPQNYHTRHPLSRHITGITRSTQSSSNMTKSENFLRQVMDKFCTTKVLIITST